MLIKTIAIQADKCKNIIFGIDLSNRILLFLRTYIRML